MPQALRITPHNVRLDAALAVPMVVAARLLLELAVMHGGLVLTPAEFLKRADVWHVFDQTEWPGYDKATTLAMTKVINEQDAYGVFFTRIALQSAGLLRTRSGVLKATKAAKALLADEAAPALLGEVFQAVSWQMNQQLVSATRSARTLPYRGWRFTTAYRSSERLVGHNIRPGDNRRADHNKHMAARLVGHNRPDHSMVGRNTHRSRSECCNRRL